MRVPGGLLRLLGLCALAGVLLAGMLAPAAIGIGEASNQLSDSVDSISSDLATSEFPLVTTVTDRDGTPIAYLFDQYRLPASYDQISPNMTAALVAIEDRRFWDHAGIDVKSALRAALSNSSGGATQGGSTLTQQYVKNFLVNVVDRNDKLKQAADSATSLVRKLREAKIAMSLDQQWTKEDIITGYLNVVEFGSSHAGPFGIRAAAAAYFNTTPDKLTVSQAALLAGMVNNPNYYDPYKNPAHALQRRNLVINEMVKNGKLSASDAKAAINDPLGVQQGGPKIPSSSCLEAAPDAGFFCQYAVEYLQQSGFTLDQLQTGGYTIKTTMDPNISQIAKQAADNRVPPTQNGVANTFDIVKPGNTSHEVLALVANRSYGQDTAQGQSQTNWPADVADPFGAGSTFKLFTTAAAMEQGKIGLSSTMPNPKSQCYLLPGLDPRYNHCNTVTNDDATNPDPIGLTEALAISPNTAFTQLEIDTGMNNVLQMAYRLGMRNSMSANFVGKDPNSAPMQQMAKSGVANAAAYGVSQLQYFQQKISFTLGTAALSPLELANVGATLASGGVWCPPTPILGVTDRYGKPVPVQQQACEQVIAPAIANTIVNGMGHDTLPGGTSGAAAANLNYHRPTAGKTGTTQVNESVAFLGMVDNYAASSIVFADGSHPSKICNTSPPRLEHDGTGCGNGGFGGTVAAPTFFNAFNQILAGQPDVPLPDADPAYSGTGNAQPIVPYVIGQQSAAATSALQQAGFHVSVQPFNSTLPAGQVVGQTPQSTMVPAGTQITIYVSTGTLPPPPSSSPPPSVAPGATTSSR